MSSLVPIPRPARDAELVHVALGGEYLSNPPPWGIFLGTCRPSLVLSCLVDYVTRGSTSDTSEALKLLHMLLKGFQVQEDNIQRELNTLVQ